MDLLRVFLYDAVASKEDQETYLGSSPHTDWGSLTIVWQDWKGGLQNYCYEHSFWNDIKLPMEDKQENNNSTFFFVHVGDFLSLAMNHCHHPNVRYDHDTTKNRRVIWPSPRHRVLCPVVQFDSDDALLSDRIQTKRCSLVYFAYPPLGVSLQDAEERLHSCEHIQRGMLNNNKEENKYTTLFPYDRYILLLDQSLSTNDNSDLKSLEDRSLTPRDFAYGTYQRFHTRPFHQIVQEKWSQVQRRS